MLHTCVISQNEYTRVYPRSSEYKYDNERTATVVVGAFHVAARQSGISCARKSAFSSVYTEGTREGEGYLDHVLVFCSSTWIFSCKMSRTIARCMGLHFWPLFCSFGWPVPT